MDTPVSGTPRLLLRCEGLVVLIAAIVAYRAIEGSWWLFALLLLVPDVALIGYAINPRVGATAYNELHTYIGPGTMAALGVAGVLPILWPACLIWVAHIGMDRALGFGLKFPSAFQSTHLGIAGRTAPTA